MKTVKLSKGQGFVVILLSCLVLLFIAGGIAFSREKVYTRELNKLHSMQQKLATYQTDYNTAADTHKKEELEKVVKNLDALLPEIEQLSTRPYSYIRQQAFFAKAMVLHIKKDYANSAPAFENVFQKYGKTILGVKAALNAAATYEDLKETDKALALYKKVSQYKKMPAFSQEATVHVGRILESTDKQAALEIYNSLINSLEADNYWRAIAENRCVLLEIPS